MYPAVIKYISGIYFTIFLANIKIVIIIIVSNLILNYVNIIVDKKLALKERRKLVNLVQSNTKSFGKKSGKNGGLNLIKSVLI